MQISLGDQQSYYLSTAKNELGVLFARSQGILDHEPQSNGSRGVDVSY
jgi:hypothetical protein